MPRSRASVGQNLPCEPLYLQIIHYIAEAETLQQRAERKRGQEAVAAFEHAAVSRLLRLAPHWNNFR